MITMVEVFQYPRIFMTWDAFSFGTEPFDRVIVVGISVYSDALEHLLGPFKGGLYRQLIRFYLLSVVTSVIHI